MRTPKVVAWWQLATWTALCVASFGLVFSVIATV